MSGRQCLKATTAVKMSVAAMSVALAALTFASAADAHRNSCHTKKTCPSDHHTYKWGPKKLLCTSYAAERKPSDRIRVVVGGRTYWCHK